MKRKIILYPNTFLWVQFDKGLLYNTESFNAKEFNVNEAIKPVCDALLNYDNLYTVSIDRNTPEVEYLITLVEQGSFGRSIDIDSERVTSLPPLLNLQSSIERIEKDPQLNIGENALTYLHTLTIYTGGVANNMEYYKQIIYPIKIDEVLNVNTVVNFIERGNSSYIHTINIVISDIEHYDVVDLCEQLSSIKDKVILYVPLLTNDNQKSLISNILSRGFKVRFICDSKFLIPASSLFEPYLPYSANVNFNLIVRSIEEYERWTNLMEKLNVNNYSIVPVYEDNTEFFNENVFLTREDILGSQLSKREIFAHQSLNTISFGQLTVMPDGLVYSNVNHQHIGKICDDITDIIVNELKQNYSWRRIRDSARCSKCLFQWLCPSPSNYEIVMQKDCICSD
ncbi:MAG: TIGR04150 pseudo-rSAM protein [Bacteroidales bacterium]